MPLFRYFLFVGGFLMCAFWALDYVNSSPLASSSPVSKTEQTVAPREVASLQSWRASEARKAGRELAGAVVMPDVASLAPTAERLAYERQIASGAITQPVATAAPTDASAALREARAEMNEPTATKPAVAVKPVKRVAKPKPVGAPMVIAQQQRPAPRFESGGLFGGFFSN